MLSVLPSPLDGVLHYSLESEELVGKAIAWQLPPDDGASCNDVTTPKCRHRRCPPFSFSPPACDAPHCAARGRAETWPCCTVQGSCLPVPSESKVSRPFLSLMLPEWVHEKAVEDEAVGLFRCTSLASFSASPTSSGASSRASSCASSPQVPSASREPLQRPAGPRARRSGVCWADLVESEDEGPMTSTISTATSSPIARRNWVSDQHGTDLVYVASEISQFAEGLCY